MLENIGLVLAILFGNLALLVVFQSTMFLGFNKLSKGINDMKELRGYMNDGTWVPPNGPYLLYRGLLVAAQLIPSATLAFVPWGVRSGDWQPFWIWIVCANFGVIVMQLLLRFGVLEFILLRRENNLLRITDRTNPNMVLLAVEGAAMIGYGLVLAGLLSGDAKDPVDGIVSSIVYALISLGIMVGWMVWRLRQKVHTFNGVGGQSLSDGIKNKSWEAGNRAIGQVMFICILLFGAVQGEFINWGDSIQKSSITLVVGVGLGIIMNKLYDRFLLHLEERIEPFMKIPVPIVSSVVLAGIALWTVGAISGSLASL